MRGLIRVRRISKSSLGITLPKDLVKNLKIDTGDYIYMATKLKNNSIELKLKLLDLEDEKGGV